MKEKFNAFVEKHKEIWKFLKFIFTGASTSVLQLAVQLLLQYVIFGGERFNTPIEDNAFFDFLGIGYLNIFLAYFISYIVGYAAAFIMNRKLTFKADSNPLVSSILYTIMVICTILVCTWMGSFFGTLLENSQWNSKFAHSVLSLVLMQVPVLWTYPLSRFVIHRKKKED